MPFQPVPPLPEGDPDAARRRADDILSGPAYRDDETIVERVLGWVDDLLADILGRLTTGGTGTLVAWLLLALAVLAVGWALRDVRPGPWRRGHVDGPDPVVRRADEPQLDAAGWLAEAERCAAAGDLDGVVRARYRASVAHLVEDGLLDDVPGRTSGEVLAELSGAGDDLLAPLAELSRRFEEIWYSPRRADPDDVAVVERLAAAVVEGSGAAALRARSSAGAS